MWLLSVNKHYSFICARRCQYIVHISVSFNTRLALLFPFFQLPFHHMIPYDGKGDDATARKRIDPTLKHQQLRARSRTVAKCTVCVAVACER